MKIDLEELQRDIHVTAKEKGFWTGSFYDDMEIVMSIKIALMHTELSEAMEAVREGNHRHVAEELGDTIIRILDTAEGLGLPVVEEMLKKTVKNKKREYLHMKLF